MAVMKESNSPTTIFNTEEAPEGVVTPCYRYNAFSRGLKVVELDTTRPL
jgi:hypothetical protein